MKCSLCIGQYTLSKQLGPLNNNCILFEVTQKYNPHSKFIASIHNFSNQISLHSLVNIMSEGKDHGKIEELFFFIKNQRRYMVVVRNLEVSLLKKQSDVRVDISSADCMRLMHEAISFVSGLHQIYLRLECDLTEFLQISSEGQTVNFPKIHPLQIYDNHQFEQSTNHFHRQRLSREQMIQMMGFFKRLPKMVRLPNKFKFKLPVTEKILASFKQGAKEINNYDITTLKKILSECTIVKDDYSLYCKLSNDAISLLVKYEHKKKKRIDTFTVTQTVEIIQNKQKIEVKELFYIISSRLPVEIKLYSRGKLHFWDQNQHKWKFIQLWNKNQQLLEEDEARQAENPWDRQDKKKTGEKSRNMTNEQKQIKRRKSHQQVQYKYPYDHIVRTRSTFLLRYACIDIQGVGTLITPNYVVTCAHNIFYKFQQKTRKEANYLRVYIPNSGGQLISKNQWKFPQQFRQNEDRSYDFALIKLTKAANKKWDLLLVVDYKQAGMMQMATQGRFSLSLDEMQMGNNINTQNIIHHSMHTKEGYSGSPFLVQPKQMNGQCYVAGIHCSGLKKQDMEYNKAIRITSKAIQKLAQFQSQLDKYNNQQFKILSLFFDQIKKVPNETEQIFKKIKQKVDNNFAWISVLAKEREQNMGDRLKKLMKKAQKFTNIINKLDEQQSSIFIKKPSLLKQKKQKSHYQYLAKKYGQYLKFQEKYQIFTLLKQLMFYSYFGNKKQGSKQRQLMVMQSLEQILGEQLKWQIYAWGISISEMKSSFSGFSDIVQDFVQVQYIQRKIYQLIGLKYEQENNSITQILNIQTKGRKQFQLRYNIPNSIAEGIFPFCSRKPIVYYTKKKIYDWQFRMEFQSKQLRNKTFWYLHNINVIFFELLIFTRNCKNQANKDKSVYSISAKYQKKKIIKSIKEQLILNINLMKGQTYPTIQGWLNIMTKIIMFTASLHQMNKSLSCVIEDSMYINSKQMSPLFYYCQPFEVLQQQYSLLNYQQKYELRDYLPKRQIEAAVPQPQKVDIWIIGKAFQRIVKNMTLLSEMDKQVNSVLMSVIRNMITTPEKRFSAVQILPYLLKYFQIYAKTTRVSLSY